MYAFLSRSFCRIPNVTNVSITARYYAATASSFRCMNKLSADHQRMRATLQSFQSLVNDIGNANTISAEQGDDLKRFMKFISYYIGSHHEKEAVLYKKTISSATDSNDVRLISAINEEHSERDDLGKTLEEIVNGLVSPTKTDKYCIDDMISTTETFLNEEYDHLDEEDQSIYPTIAKRLNENDMEEVSQVFDKMDQEKKAIINEMETISDELKNKYR